MAPDGFCRGPLRLRRAGAALATGLALAVLAGGTLACTVTPTPEALVNPTALPEGTPDPRALVWAVPAPPTTLDPAHLVNDAVGNLIAAQIYDRLVRFRPGSVELAPGLAENWEANPRERTYVFTLRKGLKFHDGEPLDAPAVLWNFERWWSRDHPLHLGSFPSWTGLFGGFQGERDGDRDRGLVRKIEALDPLTIRFTLNIPFSPFLQHLAQVPFAFASPKAVAAQGDQYGSDGEHLPVGSGPFKVASWSADGTVRLEAVPGHWAGDPGVPNIQFVVVPEPRLRAAAVASGAVLGAELTEVSSMTDTLGSAAVRIIPRPARANSWLMLNLQREPMNDVRVRRAISMAIDRHLLAKRFYGPSAEPSNQLLPPGFLGFNPDIPPPTYDPEGAKALLAEAGLKDGFPLLIWVPNTGRPFLPEPIDVGESVVSMLQAVGIKASVRSKSLREFLADRDGGRFVAWITGWEAQSGDPDNMWFWHFGAGRNAAEGYYDNPTLAASLLDAQRSLVAAQRGEIYSAAAAAVYSDTARVFLVYPRPLVLLSERVTGYQPDPMGLDNFATLRLAAPGSDMPLAPAPTSDVSVITKTATAAAAHPTKVSGTVTATLSATDTLKTGTPRATMTPTLTLTATVKAAEPVATKPPAAPALPKP